MGKKIKRTELGKKLRKLRKDRGLTIGQVAEAVGMKLNTYGKYERDINPKKGTLIKIAEFFDVSLDYLMGREAETDHNFGESRGGAGSLTLDNYSGYKPIEEEIGELTEQETLLISIFRSADEEDKKKIVRYVKNQKNKK